VGAPVAVGMAAGFMLAIGAGVAEGIGLGDI
jgi:hypothetical protein